MKIYRSIQEFKRLSNAVVTTGTFDGVHKGHEKIIERLIRTAKDHKGESVILTFFPHPRMVLYPHERTLRLLNTEAEKIALLQKAGVEHLVIQPFSKEFSEMSYQKYVSDVLLENIGARKLVIGYDHHFGHGREGGFKQLLELASVMGFEVEEIPEQDVNNVAVSSTKIRQSLAAGDVATAAQYLGYHYMLSGTVEKGNQIGRTIGYPTANIEPDEWYKLVPADGIYAVLVDVENIRYKGMLSIGTRPTIGENLRRTIEVNIFDFNKEIYGKIVTLHFVQRIRDEEKLEGLEALKQKLAEDKQQTIRLLSHF